MMRRETLACYPDAVRLREIQQQDVDLGVQRAVQQAFVLRDDVEALQVLAGRLDAHLEGRRGDVPPVALEPCVAQAEQYGQNVGQGFVADPGPFAGIPVFRLLQ